MQSQKNDSRARDITIALVDEFQGKRGIFGGYENLLESQIPHGVKAGSPAHARFYFFLIFNDHGTKSINLYDRFKTLYKNNPDFFNPAKISNLNNEQMDLFDEEFSTLGLRYPSQAKKSWFLNSEKLLDFFDGEPINLFRSTISAEELFRKIMGFRGYGPKTSGLLLRVIIGLRFNKFLVDIDKVPFPVDIHDSRIAFQCGVYRPPKITRADQIYSDQKHIKEISSIWRRTAIAVKVPWEILDRALWLQGSIGCAGKNCGVCSIQKYCSNS